MASSIRTRIEREHICRVEIFQNLALGNVKGLLGLKMSRRFIAIRPVTMSACTPAERSPDWECSDCHAPRPGLEQIDVRIQGRSPGRATLTFATGTLPIAHKDELMRLGHDRISKHLHIGSVSTEGGRLLPDWVTWRARQRAIIRGDQHVAHRKCRVCGRDIYFALGEPYLYPEPPPDVEVMQARESLIVTVALAQLLKLEEWRGVSVEPLPVLAAPRDGLPILSNPAF
jgi:hypothetical protein